MAKSISYRSHYTRTVVPLQIININDKTATDQETYKQRLQSSTWLSRPDTLFYLKKVHVCRNMLEKRI
jgi:hypothetical protein